jgi:hypothetical protein
MQISILFTSPLLKVQENSRQYAMKIRLGGKEAGLDALENKRTSFS